jgi:uncharacterized membrane protein
VRAGDWGNARIEGTISPRPIEPTYKPEMEESQESGTASLAQVRRVASDAPRRWLRAGWHDLTRAPAASLFYGLVLALMGFTLTNIIDKAAYPLAVITGFLLVGPFLAMGLYDISRRLERGDAVRLQKTLTAWKTNLPAIGLYAVILTLLMAVWIRVSVVVVALFFEGGVPSAGTRDVLGAEEGLVFLAAYGAAGAGFALLVFGTSVVSLSMLLDRAHLDTISATIVSFNALRANLATMLVWAALIVLVTALGFATLYLGLIIGIPVIGHATWHA